MSYEDYSKYARDMSGKKYFSQAGQDLFVLEMTKHKHGGFYCEIGGAHPYESNNTFILESDYKWHGISFESDPDLSLMYNQNRKNSCICTDATNYDYLSEFKKNEFPSQIDYLSLDIDPAEDTYKALLKIPSEKYRFSVVTYEHDGYSSGDGYMYKSREYLASLGYILVVSNVHCFGRDFEDWWIDGRSIPEHIWKPYRFANIEFKEIFRYF